LQRINRVTDSRTGKSLIRQSVSPRSVTREPANRRPRPGFPPFAGFRQAQPLSILPAIKNTFQEED